MKRLARWITPSGALHTVVASRATWIVLGLGAGYLLFFVRPIFGGAVMQFPVYLDAYDPIGWDLRVVLENSRYWLQTGEPPFAAGDNPYPPMASVAFLPLTLLRPETAYRLMIAATLLAYVFLSFLMPLLLGTGRRATTLLVAFLVMGLTSYGLQFELERGQFNLVAVALAFLGIAVSRLRPKLWLLGTALFLVSIQLKVYPIVFAPLFVTKWEDWRRWAPWIAGVLGASIALLFVLGPETLGKFIEAIGKQVARPEVWEGNHSGLSFASQVSSTWALPLAIGILLVVFLCLVLALFVAIRERGASPSPFLVLACTAAALVVPSSSHDYKLALLAGPAVLFLQACLAPGERSSSTVIRAGSLAVFSFAYSATLFSYTSRPPLPLIGSHIPAILTRSALPAIMVILLSGAVLVLIRAVGVSAPEPLSGPSLGPLGSKSVSP